MKRGVAGYQNKLDEQRLSPGPNLMPVDVIEYILVRHGEPAVHGPFVIEIPGVVFFLIVKNETLGRFSIKIF